MGVQKGSLYSLTGRSRISSSPSHGDGAAQSSALDRVPDAEPLERVRAALRALSTVVAEPGAHRDVFTREWRFLEEPI